MLFADMGLEMEIRALDGSYSTEIEYLFKIKIHKPGISIKSLSHSAFFPLLNCDWSAGSLSTAVGTIEINLCWQIDWLDDDGDTHKPGEGRRTLNDPPSSRVPHTHGSPAALESLLLSTTHIPLPLPSTTTPQFIKCLLMMKSPSLRSRGEGAEGGCPSSVLPRNQWAGNSIQSWRSSAVFHMSSIIMELEAHCVPYS